MKVITKQDVLRELDFYIDEIKQGKIFIFPTDTIYGLGCIATNSNSVIKIRKAKQRDEKPFAIIAPSYEWIIANFKIGDWCYNQLEKLPGKYTFILEVLEKGHIVEEVNTKDNSYGIRIPECWFSEIINMVKEPFVATSVNLSNEKEIGELSDLDKSIEKYVDYFIDEGKLEGTPSTIIDLRTKNCKILRN